MTKYVARRVRFRNGERFSILSRPGGLPVHEVTLFLAGFRRRGRAANTIHAVCTTMALLYRELDKAGIALIERLRLGQFLTVPEVNRLADAVQYRMADLSDKRLASSDRPSVIDIKRIRMSRKTGVEEVKAVGAFNQATRIRYMAQYLEFLSDYYGATLPSRQKKELAHESAFVLKALKGQIPKVSNRAKLGAREGLSKDDQDRLLAVIHPDSLDNPWERGFVRLRNWLIIVLLLATGMRRGELLGIQIGDFDQTLPQIKILRRADVPEDSRLIQPNTKTNDRNVEVRPAIMRAAWDYIMNRKKIKAARRHPLLIVADDGRPLSLKSIDKMFAQIREACPGLPITLNSHVMRHTWNERFSEQAELMGLSERREEKARNEQQGWVDDSKSAATYTRRYASRKGREIALKLQEKLDVRGN